MSSTAFERSRDLPSAALSGLAASQVNLVRGHTAILSMQAELSALASRCDQAGALDDLEYFFSRPQVQKKTPCLVTFTEGEETAPQAALLLYEHRFKGHSLHIFATDETTGRRTLVAPPAGRVRFAMSACRRLLEAEAECILVSFRHDGEEFNPAAAELLPSAGCGVRWASREREVQGYLRFEPTFEATLATVGARTRNHLRYYRRRAENMLGAAFDPAPSLSREQFLELNGLSSYPASEEIAAWRYDSQSRLTGPLLYGMRDRDRRWLSLVGGRHVAGDMEMHWQLNRTDLPSHSLSTAMRSFLIEHESVRGTKRMYFEGATTHSISHAFVRERVTDLIVLRQSMKARLMPMLLKRILPPENMLLHVLQDISLEWHALKK